MTTSEQQNAKEVFLACPVCFSGNHFRLERTGREFACEDCGFVLAESTVPNPSDAGECVFCGGSRFYFESPLDLSFLGRDSVCYVCEARYKVASINAPDERYSPRSFDNASRSVDAARWRERAEEYGRE